MTDWVGYRDKGHLPVKVSEKAPGCAVRRQLINQPESADGWADGIRGLTDNRTIFRWFCRLATLTTQPDGDVLRKAIGATRAIGGKELSRFANSGGLSDRLIVPFVAVSMMVNARLDIPKITATPYRFADMHDNFEKAISLLSEETIPSSAREAFEIMVGKQYIRTILSDAGYLAEAAQIGQNVSAYTRWMRKTVYGAEVRGVTDQWTFAIGHMVVLAYLIKGQDLQVFDFNSVKVWRGRIANRFLWDQMQGLSRNLEIVEPGSVFADNHSSQNLEWVDGRFVDYFEACGVVADRAGNVAGAILDRPVPSHPALVAFYDRSGIAPDDRIVTVHCREAGYRVNERHDLRNANVVEYLPALNELVEQGYRVIRLGDRTMTPLPATDGVIDYATSALKSPELDVLLPATAAFHIGSSSGLSLVPLLYGTPCLFLNWYPFDLLPWGRGNWTVLKPIEALADRQPVIDRVSYAALGRMRERRLLNSFGYDARDLNASEISQAVAGFARTLDTAILDPDRSADNIGRIVVADRAGLRDLV
ncbi:TIGR04372 family glycosyltransferase [Thalassobaculum sp.]|uniref:TIGR04372 family glycosyltransferase n=1 Tax=Thalassobaculum sp. TaxID=2022740 RepID=UPI0032F06708